MFSILIGVLPGSHSKAHVLIFTLIDPIDFSFSFFSVLLHFLQSASIGPIELIVY